MALKQVNDGSYSRLQVSTTRIAIVWFSVGCLFIYILARLFWIQVLYPENLIREGNARVVRNYHYEPPRGLITDRNGKILAISVPVKSVEADPKFLHEEGVYDDPSKMKKLASILLLIYSSITDKLMSSTKRLKILHAVTCI